MLTNLIGCIAELVNVNKRPDKNQGAQNIPQPEIRSAEIGINSAAPQLVSDSVGNVMEPDKDSDAQRDRPYQKEKQAIMHGFLTVIPAGDDVDRVGNVGVKNNCVNPQSDNTEEYVFYQGTICFHLPDRRRRRLILRVCFCFFYKNNPPSM